MFGRCWSGMSDQGRREREMKQDTVQPRLEGGGEIRVTRSTIKMVSYSLWLSAKVLLCYNLESLQRGTSSAQKVLANMHQRQFSQFSMLFYLIDAFKPHCHGMHQCWFSLGYVAHPTLALAGDDLHFRVRRQSCLSPYSSNVTPSCFRATPRNCREQ